MHVHRGLCYLPVGAALEEKAVCHLLIGSQMNRQVLYENPLICRMKHSNLRRNKRKKKRSLVSVKSKIVVNAKFLMVQLQYMPQVNFEHLVNFFS